MKVLKIVPEINDSVLVEASSARLKKGTILVYDKDRQIVGTAPWDGDNDSFFLYVDGVALGDFCEFTDLMNDPRVINQYDFELLIKE